MPGICHRFALVIDRRCRHRRAEQLLQAALPIGGAAVEILVDRHDTAAAVTVFLLRLAIGSNVLRHRRGEILTTGVTTQTLTNMLSGAQGGAATDP